MGMIINSETLLVVEDKALSGVKKVAGCVSADMGKVFGKENAVLSKAPSDNDNYILAATCGYSDEIRNLDLSDIEGKREVYKYVMVNNHLFIIGSDKRGTIYGLFALSELLGVSPLTDWFKIMPAKLDAFEIKDSMLITSREPSVRYRGFFINDEWPAFGNWCTKNFGGFNAKAYEQVFMVLLRMKGNYMWPAMWSAIFPDDGPGLANAELADELGVVMGMSHHEPCLRQGEEYRYVRGKDSIYGDAWNFRSNEEGITRFWEDGLKRSGRFENVITVGMRGEADTAIMGKDATLKDNIDLLRDVLKTQNRLIKENVNPNLDKVPRMLALYKEVEPYYYGDENTKGLMDDPELEGVTLMLCDDNYGNLRTVPTEQMRNHKGGYGMYYHFDYHGYPISFEWSNSSYLPKVWEQMSAAYEFGIRDLWIVNVGDLFTMEYPLSYFLDMAYDYDKWGSTNFNSAEEYTRFFVEKNFGKRCEDAVLKDMYDLLIGYTRIAHKRRPEAMNSEIYDPFWYGETSELLDEIERLEKLADKIEKSVDEDLVYPVFEIMNYPARGNLNVQKLQLKTGLNHAYAKRSQTTANKMAEEVNKCLAEDEKLIEKLHTIDNGRWYGMGMSEHIGFKNWCEEECQYPVLHTFKAGNKPRIIVSVPGTNQFTEGGPWTGRELTLGDFLNPLCKEAYIELATAGAMGHYQIETDDEFLEIDNTEGTVQSEEILKIRIGLDRNKLKKAEAPNEVTAGLRIKTDGGNIKIKVPVTVSTASEIDRIYEQGTYIWLGSDEVSGNGYYPYQYVSIEAEGYSSLTSTNIEGQEASFRVLPGYGKTVSAIKAYPVNQIFTEENAPKATYTFEVKRDGTYVIETYMNPTNAPYTDGNLYYSVCVNDGKMRKVNALPEGFKVGDNQINWLYGVLDNIRKNRVEFELKAGINTVTFSPLSPGFVLEKLVIFEKGCEPAASYLGPKETYRSRG